MNNISINHKWNPLFDSDNRDRYFICTGGRGSSKSFSVTTFLLSLTYEQGHKILFTRYTLTSAKTSIIPQFIECMELLERSEEFDVTNDVITNKQTGSQIIFKGIKTSSGVQTASLKSLTGITTFVVDEAEELVDEQVFNKIDYSVRVKGVQNRVILIMNPTTVDHWIYNRWFLNGQTSKNTTYIHTDYRDNIENLNEDIVAEFEELKVTKPKEYEHVVLGGWKLKADGVIFEDWERGEFDESLGYVYGGDFGMTNDPSTIVRVSMDKKKRLIYVEELFYGKCDTIQLLEIYKNIVGFEDVAICDSAELMFINLLIGENIQVIPTTKNKKGWSRELGIKEMQSYKIIVCGESTNLVTELNNYAWIRGLKHGNETSIPMDGYDHCIDPTRYCTQFLTINE